MAMRPIEAPTSEIVSGDMPGLGPGGRCHNIAAHLSFRAAEAPNRPAVVVSNDASGTRPVRYSELSFAEFESLSNRYANGLASIGINQGRRVLVMVRPGFDFVAIIFALFKLRTVPVMIDPGMGVRRLLECIRQVELHAVIGVGAAQVVRVLRPRSFRTVRHVVTVGRRWFWGGSTLSQLARDADDHFEIGETAADETAAILFTSGSTGPAKGVVYTHGMFEAQVQSIQQHYDIKPGEVDLPTFPLFALFDPAMGMTCVIPDMDPSRPANVDPARIVRAIIDRGVTNTFGSPALWRRVAAHCVHHGIKLPSIRRILIAGAPVPFHVIEQLRSVIDPDADVHTPYGATESLPATSISGREIVALRCAVNYASASATKSCAVNPFSAPDHERDSNPASCAVNPFSAPSGKPRGTCVGRPLANIILSLIRITDEPIPTWSDDLLVADGEFGEIVVSGPVVTKEYFGLPAATASAKIRDGDSIRHRIGDIGYRDGDGRVWFCGRKAHRVETTSSTLYSVLCESVFNQHGDVQRSALVGVGEQGHKVPAIVVEPRSGRFPKKAVARDRIVKELLQLGADDPMTSGIKHVLFHRDLPVDVRHNAKINREALTVWATGRLR